MDTDITDNCMNTIKNNIFKLPKTLMNLKLNLRLKFLLNKF